MPKSDPENSSDKTHTPDPQSIEGLFVSALAKEPGDKREEFLDQTCGEDDERRMRIVALLRAYDDAGSFLERPISGVHATQSLDLSFLEKADDPSLLGKLGSYEVYELIGRGGMGMVFRARDPKLNRVVAIKVLAPELAAHTNARLRFLREAQAAAAISHPHVVTIHAVEDRTDDATNALPFIVMECIVGQTLQQKLDKQGSLPLTEIVRISQQMADGLAAAHKQGLVHRDIKPANILLENGVERVKISDFGLARAVDDATITRTGEVSGTPQYMSPEQASGERVDHRSDLFSLGCVMYAMCTGRSPFRSTSLVAAIKRVCHDTPRPIAEINPELPAWLIQFINQLLDKEPDQRPQSSAEVAAFLEQHLANLQQPGRPVANIAPATIPSTSNPGPPPIPAAPALATTGTRDTEPPSPRYITTPIGFACALLGVLAAAIATAVFLRTTNTLLGQSWLNHAARSGPMVAGLGLLLALGLRRMAFPRESTRSIGAWGAAVGSLSLTTYLPFLVADARPPWEALLAAIMGWFVLVVATLVAVQRSLNDRRDAAHLVNESCRSAGTHYLFLGTALLTAALALAFSLFGGAEKNTALIDAPLMVRASLPLGCLALGCLLLLFGLMLHRSASGGPRALSSYLFLGPLGIVLWMSDRDRQLRDELKRQGDGTTQPETPVVVLEPESSTGTMGRFLAQFGCCLAIAPVLYQLAFQLSWPAPDSVFNSESLLSLLVGLAAFALGVGLRIFSDDQRTRQRPLRLWRVPVALLLVVAAIGSVVNLEHQRRTAASAKSPAAISNDTIGFELDPATRPASTLTSEARATP